MPPRSRKRGTANSSRPAPAQPVAAQAWTPEVTTVRARPAPGSTWAWAVIALGLLAVGAAALAFFSPGLLPWQVQPQPTATAPLPYSPDGRISFVRKSSDGSRRDLYVVNPNGSHQEQVTSDIVVEGANVWSPDGLRILIQASVNGVSTVVRINIGPDNRPSDAVQLTADVKADSVLPAWSPDGTQIAFQSKRDGGNYQVFSMDVNGNNKRRLSDGKDYSGQPAWSPDGKSVAYVGGGNGDQLSPRELYVVPATGGDPKKITSLDKALNRPEWSPDGKNILVLQDGGQGNRSFLMIDSSTGSARTVLDSGANSSPQLSPKGDGIAYYAVSAKPPVGSDVFVIPVSGGTSTNLTTQSTDDYLPAWSPDGKLLTWASSQGGSHRIVVGNPDGSKTFPISSGDGDDYQPSWGPPVK
jgi:Tol biopolymer transport system component